MNPYSSPDSDQNISSNTSVNSELSEIVKGWERMRIHYNIILLVTGIIAILLLMRTAYFNLEESLLPAIAFGISANICFCAGPVVEIYVRVIFNMQHIRPLRIKLFILGTIISLLPAAIAVLGANTALLPAIN